MYLLFYVEGCNPRIKKLKTKKSIDNFINKFYKKYPNWDKEMYGDNWIDLVVKGRIILDTKQLRIL